MLSQGARPDLRAVEQPQNSYPIRKFNISGNVGCTGDHKFPGTGYPARPSGFWEFQKLLHNRFDPLIDPNRRRRILGFDKVEDCHAVSNSQS